MNTKTGVSLPDCAEKGLVSLWETRERVVTRGPGPTVAEGELVRHGLRTHFQDREKAVSYLDVFGFENRGPR